MRRGPPGVRGPHFEIHCSTSLPHGPLGRVPLPQFGEVGSVKSPQRWLTPELLWMSGSRDNWPNLLVILGPSHDYTVESNGNLFWTLLPEGFEL